MTYTWHTHDHYVLSKVTRRYVNYTWHTHDHLKLHLLRRYDMQLTTHDTHMTYTDHYVLPNVAVEDSEATRNNS